MIRTSAIALFVSESNAIEGIYREPTQAEIEATSDFCQLTRPSLEKLMDLQQVYAPGMPLRTEPGMDVRVGNYIAPRGGPEIKERLVALPAMLEGHKNPWLWHQDYETLHPFLDGNGRTGRALWAWHMLHLGRDPFRLSFLHRYYYQTLENSR